MSKLIIATRGSKLALWQAAHVATLLKGKAGVACELKVIRTSGDRFTDRPLSEVVVDDAPDTSDQRLTTGKGLFVKEIEEALLAGEADMAVHSLKDLPAAMPRGLELVAALEREDARDALVSRGEKLAGLPAGAKLGTCSPRRAAQLKMLRPQLEIVPLRGNLDSRLRKVEEGEVDATLLALAGLKRMGWQDRAAEILGVEDLLPAAGQGIIGLEAPGGNAAALAACAMLSHGPSMAAARAERSFVLGVGADCRSPVGVYATISGALMQLQALVASPDGSRALRLQRAGSAADPEGLGKALAEEMLVRGAGELLV